MKNTAAAVRGLEAERQMTARIPIERCSPGDELAYVAQPILDENIDHGLVAQASPSPHGVGGMQRRAVVGAECRRDSALRVAGVAFRGVCLGQDQRAAGWGERNRGAKPRDATADDEELGLHNSWALSSQLRTSALLASGSRICEPAGDRSPMPPQWTAHSRSRDKSVQACPEEAPASGSCRHAIVSEASRSVAAGPSGCQFVCALSDILTLARHGFFPSRR